VIPAGVTSIGTSAFELCSALTAITVNAANPNYSSTNGVLYNKNQSTLIQFPEGRAGTLSVPASVTSILSTALTKSPNLTEINASPSSATYSSIDGILFNKNATSLVRCPGGRAIKVVVPVGVTSIASSAFASCGLFSEVSLPAGLTTIGSGSFFTCGSLTSVTLPALLSNIGAGAFSSCGKLRSACFLGNAPNMGSGVFTSAAAGFKIYFFSGKSGFTTPTWLGYQSVNMGAYSAVAPWLLSKGLAYNATLSSDSNSDGVNLLLAYAFNLDPRQMLSKSMPVPVISGNIMSISFQAGVEGVSYSVQRSNNLQNWTTAGVNLSIPDTTGVRTATVEMSEPNTMLRIVCSY
jgi:hypothetical protein